MISKVSSKLLIIGFTLFVFMTPFSVSGAEVNAIQVKDIKGLVQIQKGGTQDWIKAEEDSQLVTGDSIRSFMESTALLIFPDKSEFSLGENSSLDIKDISRNPRTKAAKRELKLNLGTLHYKVPPKEETASEFKIHSSTSIVGITGTEGIITAAGEGKVTENILIEGSTYNTDEQGQGGVYQTEGNVYNNDGEDSNVYGSDVEEEAKNRLALDEEYVTLIKGLVAKYEKKRGQGYDVADVEAMIEQAFTLLENRAYDRVRSIVQEAEVLLEKAEKIDIPDDLKEEIEALIEQVKNKETDGFDVSIIYPLLDKIHTYAQNGQFEEIDNLIVLINQKLASLVKKEETGEDDEGDDFLAHYQEIQEFVLEKESKGFALDEIKATLRRSFIYYENGNRAKAFQLLDKAKDDLHLVLKELSDSLQQKIDKLTASIATKKEEGYQTEDLELQMEEVKKFIEGEDFIKVQELLGLIEESLLTLKKGIPIDWEVKLHALKEAITYKESLGYDLTKIHDLTQALEKHLADGDLTLLEEVYLKIEQALAQLGLPAGFEADWKNFLARLKAKEDMGLDLKNVNDLKDKVQAAIDSGDINLARSFLKKAKEKLQEIKDTEPPNVQILTFEESSESITVEGFASDNAKVKSVSVNNSLVDVSEVGQFSYATAPAPGLEALTIVAEDFAGNTSPPIKLKLTVEVTETDVTGEIEGARIEYKESSFVVLGQFIPGGKVEVGVHEAFCDNDGNFAVTIDLSAEEIEENIIIVGWNSDGTKTNEVALEIKDQWPPLIEITKVYFTQNVAPTLTVNPLKYTATSAIVSGEVVVTVMGNVEGQVSDLGGEVSLLKIAGREVDLSEKGTFIASFSLSPEEVSALVYAEDKAGNSVEENVAFDAIFKPPVVKINSEDSVLNSEGAFSEEIFLSKEIDEIVVELVDGQGAQITSKRFPVADILPPELEVSDVSYADNKVTVKGATDPKATVQDKNKTLFAESFEASDDGLFTLTADMPQAALVVILVATNIEGKTSIDVPVKIDPPIDEDAPKLYISYPFYEKNQVVIEGSVEDESEIESVTVQGAVVTLTEQNRFSERLEMTDDLASVVIVAKDIFGNVTQETIAVADQEPPVIIIDTWEVRDGKFMIAGKAQDNVGLKEVRLNKMPIAHGRGESELAFSYEGALDEDSKDAVIVAVDLFNNETHEGPREIEIPVDTAPPQGESIGIEYGSPEIYVSGMVTDPAGIKAVYVNGSEVDVFTDGSFNVKVDIEVASPKITLETPSYDNGKVAIAGKVAVGDFIPSKITVEAQDLSGNRGVLFTQDVAPYKLDEITVFVNRNVVAIDEAGAFSHEQGMVAGQRTIEVKALDPFDNTATSDLKLESNAPLLELGDLTYNLEERLVLLSGKATDGDSGLYTLLVNGIRIDFNEEGSFSFSGSLTESSLSVLATDYVGNVTTLTKEVTPPDFWPPVFLLEIKPMPAIIGNPVYVEITALDSKTGMPEMLSSAPTVNAAIDGTVASLQVQGEGANYIATLETDGLSPALVTIDITGEDTAGNTSSEIAGTSVFTLVEEDTIVPSFTLEAIPSPIEIGEEAMIKVFASEEIKELPQLEVVLPSGTVSSIDLTKVNAQEFEASLSISLEEGIGNAVLRLTGGEDLSGNFHETTENTVAVIAPVQETELPLNVEHIEFLVDKFTLKGLTASEAVVHIEVAEHSLDIVADVEGRFAFERPIALEELEEMHSVSEVIRVKIKAHNYAGFESPSRVFELALPDVPEQGGENFNIMIQPFPVAQGDFVTFNIEVLQAMTGTPQGLLYFPDGQRIAVDLSGGNVLSGQYQVPEDAALGTAMFEVVAGTVRESLNFEIMLSSEWMQRLNKDEFFMIRVMPDPIIIGKEAEFIVDTMGDMDSPPELRLMLPNGQVADIPLSGGPRNFQGRYVCPVDVPSGRAEIVLNPGTPDEVRRPFGVEEEFVEGVGADAFLFANPQPLLGGEPYEVQISFSEEISFVPLLTLRLNDGRGIEVPLEGSAPSNKFGARSTLSSDVITGLATFVLKDDNGMVIDIFPTQVTPPLTSARGVNVFVVPDMAKPLDMVTINLNSTSAIDEKLEAHVSFVDGSKIRVSLEGSETAFNGIFQVPDYAPFGMMTISVFDENRNSLGTARAEVVEQGHSGGMLRIFVDNPNFGPGDSVRMGVEANWPLPFIPKAELKWDGGSLNIPLRGRIPGNRFGTQFTAPNEPIENGVIEVKDDGGYLLGEYHLEHRPDGEGDVIVTPMPPVIGQPLSIKVIAPTMVNSAPMMRLTFGNGATRELNAYGAIPGNTFTASLDRLIEPLMLIEIVHEGTVVASIPVENLDRRPPMEFDVEPFGELIPGAMVDVAVRANVEVPFIPRLSMDFQGVVVDVPLNGMPFSYEFFGKLNIPVEASLDQVNAMIFDPQGKLLWQRMYSQNTATGGYLFLNVMPSGEDGFDLSWDMVRGVDMFQVRYGETPALANAPIEVRGSTFHHVAGLVPGTTYFFQVAAFMGRQEIMASDTISAVAGQTQRELFVQEMVMGNEVHLMWPYYPGADGYRVAWGDAPGALVNSTEVGGTGFMIPDLLQGTNYFVKVFALQVGQVIGESREIFISLSEVFINGEIFFIPEPPVQGQDLQIRMHFSADLPFGMPGVMARLETGDVPLLAMGALRDFTALLPADQFTAPLMSVDAMDPQGMVLASRYVGGGPMYPGGSQVPIHVTPDPPMIGMDLLIRAEFSTPPPFVPGLMVELASGMKRYTFPQGPNMPMYEILIPAAEITSSVMRIEVQKPDGMFLGDRFFGSTSGGGSIMGPMVRVTPALPEIGMDMMVEVDFMEPVPFRSLMRVEFEDGRIIEYPFPQGFGMAIHSTTVPAGAMTSYVRRIEIVEAGNGRFIIDWFPGIIGPRGFNVPLYVIPDPPVIGFPVDMTLDIPNMVPLPPTLRIYYGDGTQEEVAMLGITPGMHFNYQIPSLLKNITTIDVIDSETAVVSFTWTPGGTATGPEMYVTNLSVIPNPPQINQDISVHVEFNQLIPFQPRWRLDLASGPIEGTFSQAPGLMMYDQIIPAAQITTTAMRLEVLFSSGMLIPGGEIDFVNPDNFTCTSSFNPFPPVPYTDVFVTATYPPAAMPSYKPYIFIEVEGLGFLTPQPFPQAAGFSTYSHTVPGALLTGNVLKIGIGDLTTGIIDCGEDFVMGSDLVTLTTTPDPPEIGVDLTVTATFDHPVPFKPRLFIDFSDSPPPAYGMREYDFPQAAGFSTYVITILGAEIDSYVDKIFVMDPLGGAPIPNELVFSAGGGAGDLPIVSANGTNKINISWTPIPDADTYKIHFGTAPGDYSHVDSPVVLGDITGYILGEYETLAANTTYYIKVEAWAGDIFIYNLGGSEVSQILSSSIIAPPDNVLTQCTGVSSEIRVFWDQVTGVDGYKIYYGTSPGSYSESGSPLEVPGFSITNEVITSLIGGETYYIVVRSYLLDGTESLDSDPEVVASCGGSLTAAPAMMPVSANAGESAIQQTVTITNNGGAAANVKFAINPSFTKPGHSFSSSNMIISPVSASIPPSSFSNFTVDISVPGGTPAGDYNGGIIFYDDINSNSIQDSGETSVTLPITLTVSGGGGGSCASLDHVAITGAATSATMGTPIFVTLTAHDNIETTLTACDTTITIDLSESVGGHINNSWLVSTQDRVDAGGATTASVDIASGVGYFTVDAVEPETITISATGGDDGDLALTFAAAQGGPTLSSFAIQGPARNTIGTTAVDAASIWISALDATGQVITNYAQTVTISVSGNDLNTPKITANDSSSFNVNFSGSNGQVQVFVKDADDETVTVTATKGGVSDNVDIVYVGVSNFFVYAETTQGTIFSGVDDRINFVIRATDGTNIVEGYNGTATWSGAGVGAGSATATPSSITFVDGKAQFFVDDSIDETIEFQVVDSSITTGTIQVTFENADSAKPTVTEVVAENLYLIHLYFSESLDSDTANEKTNYTVHDTAGDRTVNIVCWYGDNVTIHLQNPLTRGGSFSVDIVNVKDLNTNVIAAGTNETGTAPLADYTGGPVANNGADWLELQPSNASPSAGEQVTVTVYHKNACGYLGGSNALNATTDPALINAGSANIDYTGSVSGQDTSISFSDGKGTFVFTADDANTITISITKNGVTGTLTIN